MNKNEIMGSRCVAYYSGWGGIEITEIENGFDDYVLFRAPAWCSGTKPHRAKVYYDAQIPYFKYNGHRISLNECIRNG